MSKSVEEVRSDIPFLETGTVYLDNAATTPTPEPVIAAMEEYYHEYNANVGRGIHRAAERATEAFESSREKIAKTINAKPEEIIYTKNTTEALNLIARGLGLESGEKVVATILEHHSNLLPWQRLEDRGGIDLKIVRENSEFMIDSKAVGEAVDEDTRIITIPHVSNAFGTKQPAEEIGKIAEEKNILFSLDAAQSVGHMPVDVKEIGCDFLASPGHKGLLGPQGTGFLYIREDHQEEIEPLLWGGGIVQSVSEHGCELVDPPQVFDGGTPNIPGVIGLGEAAEYVLEIGLEKIEKRERELVEKMTEIGRQDGIEVYGPEAPERMGGALSFNVEGMDPHEVSSILDERGDIATRSGCHCAMPAMKYLGLEGTVRASVHFYNSKGEISYFVDLMEEISKQKT